MCGTLVCYFMLSVLIISELQIQTSTALLPNAAKNSTSSNNGSLANSSPKLTANVSAVNDNGAKLNLLSPASNGNPGQAPNKKSTNSSTSDKELLSLRVPRPNIPLPTPEPVPVVTVFVPTEEPLPKPKIPNHKGENPTVAIFTSKTTEPVPTPTVTTTTAPVTHKKKSANASPKKKSNAVSIAEFDQKENFARIAKEVTESTIRTTAPTDQPPITPTEEIPSSDPPDHPTSSYFGIY